MRRDVTMAALVAMMLAAGGPAMAQTPNMVQMQPKPQIQLKPKVQPRVQIPKTNKPSNMVLIKPSQALIIAQRMVPNSKAVGVKLLPGGNYAVTLKRNNTALRVIIDGDTGERR